MALANEAKIGTIRETFFVSQLRQEYNIKVADSGDFVIGDKFIVEIGGKSKSFKQIKDMQNSYLIVDTDNTQNSHKIPLWLLFGFLY